MAQRYTKRQGEYLAFIHLYTKMHRQAPAEANIQAYFGVTGPSVHGMIVSLTEHGLIERVPRQARSIRVLVPPEELPGLDGTPPSKAEAPFAERYPNIAFWVTEQGWIELGYEPNTDSCARALIEDGMVWSGGHPRETVDDWLKALEAGIEAFVDEQGLRPS